MQVMTFPRYMTTCYTLDICFLKKAMNDKFILKKSFSDRKIVALNHLLVLSPYIHLQDSSCLEKIRKREDQKWKLKGTFISLLFNLSSNWIFLVNSGEQRWNHGFSCDWKWLIHYHMGDEPEVLVFYYHIVYLFILSRIYGTLDTERKNLLWIQSKLNSLKSWTI